MAIRFLSLEGVKINEYKFIITKWLGNTSWYSLAIYIFWKTHNPEHMSSLFLKMDSYSSGHKWRRERINRQNAEKEEKEHK